MRYPPALPIDPDGLPVVLADRAEEVAARILRQLTAEHVEKVDRDGVSGVHDLDVVHSDGRRTAVEVTMCIDPDAAGFVAALEEHGAVHFNVGLNRSWQIRLHESVQVRGLIDRITSLLEELERRNINGIARPGDYEPEPLVRYDSDEGSLAIPDAVYRLLTHGVDTAWAFDEHEGQQRIEFIRRSGGGSGCTEHLVTEEVERAAIAKEAVLSRPTAGERDARHLFVWLDPDYCVAEFALWSGRPSSAPSPDLPQVIDHVWVACWSLTPGQGSGHVVVWEAPRGEAWDYPDALDWRT